MFKITAFYELNKINDNKTSFKYTVTNRPLTWYATEKVLIEFLERVKNVAEAPNK